MRGARICRRKPHRFLTTCTCQTASRSISGRSTSGGGGGGVRGVGDRLQASLLGHCARQLVPQELASSLFRAASFLVPLLVQIPQQYVGLLCNNDLVRGDVFGWHIGCLLAC